MCYGDDMDAVDVKQHVGWCFKYKKEAYHKVKNIMRCKFLNTKYRPRSDEVVFEKGFYNVAWHIRVGDIARHANDSTYFQVIKGHLDVALQGYQVRHYFFSEDSGSGTGPPTGFPFLKALFTDSYFVNTMGVEPTLYHFANADLLIATGSSFPLIASVISPKPIVIVSTPKEGRFYRVYELPDHVLLDAEGQLLSTSLSQLQASIQVQHSMYDQWFFPWPDGWGEEGASSSVGGRANASTHHT